MVLWTDAPISTVELCSSFRVIFGLFFASLINDLLAWSVSFGGWPYLGRFGELLGLHGATCLVVPLA